MRIVLVCVALFVFAVTCFRPTHFGCGTKCGNHIQLESKPGIQNCTEYFYNQTVDHFSYGLPSGGSYKFSQRFFLIYRQ